VKTPGELIIPLPFAEAIHGENQIAGRYLSWPFDSADHDDDGTNVGTKPSSVAVIVIIHHHHFGRAYDMA
jgi:hypothetical protein